MAHQQFELSRRLCGIIEALQPDRSGADLLGGEPFNEDHGGAAVWAAAGRRELGFGSS